jgi:solute carrier family 25 (mitochondrial uncoupling protein), member 27
MQAFRSDSESKKLYTVRETFYQILKEGGVRGLWRGSLINVQRAAIVNLGDLVTYDLVKTYLLNNLDLKDDYKTHILSSISSGLVAATMGTPADVIKTRIMNQPIDSNGK